MKNYIINFQKEYHSYRYDLGYALWHKAGFIEGRVRRAFGLKEEDKHVGINVLHYMFSFVFAIVAILATIIGIPMIAYNATKH